MLFIVAIILLIVWLLGIFETYAVGAFGHMLLVASLVVFLIGWFTGRRTLAYGRHAPHVSEKELRERAL